MFVAPEHLHLQNKYKEILSNSYRMLLLKWYPYINAVEAHKKTFFKSSFYVSLFSAFINVFLWLCTIDTFVAKSVILIPSLMYASLLFYCMKNKMLFGVKGI